MLLSLRNHFANKELCGKLVQLGARTDTQFSWVFDTLNNRWEISGHPVEAIGLMHPGRECYPAYSVAELGILLPTELPNHVIDCQSYYDSHHGYFGWIINFNNDEGEIKVLAWNGDDEFETEADARADMLIYTMENVLEVVETE